MSGAPLNNDQVESSVRLSGRRESGSFPVAGRLGGKAGRGYGLRINDTEVDHGTSRTLNPGDRVRFTLSGGGGYGDPLERDPALVLDDVREGRVSAAGARDDYGVIIDGRGGIGDGATQAARRARRAGT